MPTVTTRRGDCLHSIADAHGLFWETIWNHPENRELKSAYATPSQLKPGDHLFVPEKTRKEESGGTETKHTFRRKGVPCKLSLKLIRPMEDDRKQESNTDDGDDDLVDVVVEDAPVESVEEEPWADCAYRLEVDGKVMEGQTNADGVVEQNIAPSAKKAILIMDPGGDDETVIPIMLGGVDPPSSISGVKQRLRNLGYGVEDDDDEESESLVFGLKAFQNDHSLEVTGKIDDATRDKLKDLHGS